ncbi:hypothetical protein BH11MYX1_BH11MYX1_39820 [soil metagenome]
MITRRDVVHALERQELADWVVIERDQEIAVVEMSRGASDPGEQREEHRTRWQLTVHADTPAGRGTARVVIDANDGDSDKIVGDAATLARLSVGTAWTTLPQAAPARVELADPSLASGTAIAAAGALARRVPRREGATVEARVTLLRERVAIHSRSGFRTEWSATLARIDALVIASDRSLEVSREARRADGLELVATIDDTIADLRLFASAGAPVVGPCVLILSGDALLHRGQGPRGSGGGLGVWEAFISQADAVVSRQGLTRYHERAVIAAGADQVAEPLSIRSNGAMPFGVRSAPVGDDGDAVRTFSLVDHGIAAGLGLDPREAALLRRDPNGGVRNLSVSLGTWDEKTVPADVRVIDVRRLRGLEIDPYTGDGDLEISLAIDRTTGKPFTGGTVRLDLIDALARARRSARQLRRGPYEGPAAVLIEHAELR